MPYCACVLHHAKWGYVRLTLLGGTHPIAWRFPKTLAATRPFLAAFISLWEGSSVAAGRVAALVARLASGQQLSADACIEMCVGC